jgi:hypothetical protein
MRHLPHIVFPLSLLSSFSASSDTSVLFLFPISKTRT